MNIHCTGLAVQQAKSVVQKLRTSDKFPFTDVLSPQLINEKLADIPYRKRVFSPDLTVYGFLSQALSADQSCQAAVSQIIAHFS